MSLAAEAERQRMEKWWNENYISRPVWSAELLTGKIDRKEFARRANFSTSAVNRAVGTVVMNLSEEAKEQIAALIQEAQ